MTQQIASACSRTVSASNRRSLLWSYSVRSNAILVPGPSGPGYYRDAFVKEVDGNVSYLESPRYAAVLDDLIEWSKAWEDVIGFAPVTKPKKQLVFRFCLVATGEVFWSASPRNNKDDGAKFEVLAAAKKGLAPELREAILKEFARIGEAKDNLPESAAPKLSFTRLFHQRVREEVKTILGTALDRVRNGT